jgi:hypothetical protein
MTKDELVARILDAHETLHSESDLSPRNHRINAVLSALVRGIMEGCTPGEMKSVLEDPDVCAVRNRLVAKLAIAEGEMERCWGEQFCARDSLTIGNFGDFIYWDCYRHLVENELRGLRRLGVGGRQGIAFVGAGPLPLSAVIMHARTGLRITCIDLDPQACRLAHALCRKAGLAGIDIVDARGEDYDYRNCPVVFIAGLVPDKEKVIARTRATQPRALAAVRSAEGLCTLLYDPVDEAAIEALGCRFLGRTTYNSYTINTTLFYEVTPALQAKAPGVRPPLPGPALPLRRPPAGRPRLLMRGPPSRSQAAAVQWNSSSRVGGPARQQL